MGGSEMDDDNFDGGEMEDIEMTGFGGGNEIYEQSD
jgi:hypothetical protein